MSDTPIDPQEVREERVIALLMGELDPPEAEEVRGWLQNDTALAAFHQRMQGTMDLLTATVQANRENAEASALGLTRLSDNRRQALLEHLRQPQGAEAPARPRRLHVFKPIRLDLRRYRWAIPMAAAACLIAFLGLLALRSVKGPGLKFQMAASTPLKREETGHSDFFMDPLQEKEVRFDDYEIQTGERAPAEREESRDRFGRNRGLASLGGQLAGQENIRLYFSADGRQVATHESPPVEKALGESITTTSGAETRQKQNIYLPDSSGRLATANPTPPPASTLWGTTTDIGDAPEGAHLADRESVRRQVARIEQERVLERQASAPLGELAGATISRSSETARPKVSTRDFDADGATPDAAATTTFQAGAYDVAAVQDSDFSRAAIPNEEAPSLPKTAPGVDPLTAFDKKLAEPQDQNLALYSVAPTTPASPATPPPAAADPASRPAPAVPAQQDGSGRGGVMHWAYEDTLNRGESVVRFGEHANASALPPVAPVTAPPTTWNAPVERNGEVPKLGDLPVAGRFFDVEGEPVVTERYRDSARGTVVAKARSAGGSGGGGGGGGGFGGGQPQGTPARTPGAAPAGPVSGTIPELPAPTRELDSFGRPTANQWQDHGRGTVDEYAGLRFARKDDGLVSDNAVISLNDTEQRKQSGMIANGVVAGGKSPVPFGATATVAEGMEFAPSTSLSVAPLATKDVTLNFSTIQQNETLTRKYGLSQQNQVEFDANVNAGYALSLGVPVQPTPTPESLAEQRLDLDSIALGDRLETVDESKDDFGVLSDEVGARRLAEKGVELSEGRGGGRPSRGRVLEELAKRVSDEDADRQRVTATGASTLVADAGVLFESGQTREEQQKLKEALEADPANKASLDQLSQLLAQPAANQSGLQSRSMHLGGITATNAVALNIETIEKNQPLNTAEDLVAQLATPEKSVTDPEPKVELAQEAKQVQPPELTPPQPKQPPAEPLPEILTADNAFSTFSLNVSDVSFKLATASLDNQALPEPGSVRSEEFVNALDYHDPAPVPGMPLAFAWDQARHPFAHNRDLLRFSIQTAALGREAGRPLNLVLLLDNSGSMERADRVQIIRQALGVLAHQLTPRDKVSVVAFARTPRLWVDAMQGGDAEALLQEVGQLNPEGGTNLELALELAYETAHKHFLQGGVNRVILLTDGAANLGNVNPAALREKVESQRRQDIAMDCFGIGWEGYNDDLLEQLSRNGDGRYGFINDAAQAATEFADQLAGALRVAASNVKAQVEFNPGRVNSYRQVGYEKHQLTKEQFRDNTVDAAEIGAAESGTALYAIQVNPRGQGPLGVVRVRYQSPADGQYHELEWLLPYRAGVAALDQASPAMRLAGVAASFAEWLASSPYAANVTLADLQRLMQGVPETFPTDTRAAQLARMIQQARQISGQ